MKVVCSIKNKLRQYLRTFKKLIAHYIGGLYRRIDEHHVFLLSSGLAFSVFVCVIPLVLIIFAALGIVLEKPTIRDEIVLFIEHIIPHQDYANYIQDLVFSRVDEFVIYKNLAGTIGIVGILIASSGLFSSMRTVLNTVYRIRSQESILLGKLRDMGLIVLVLIYFLLSTTILPGLKIIKEFTYKNEIIKDFFSLFPEGLVLQSISFFLILSSFLIIYFTVPHRKLPWKTILISGLSAAILWHIASQLFGFYVANFITFKRIYGTYALILAIAFWIYYTSLVFILGAEIGQLYREWGDKRALPVMHFSQK
ncbi:MAG: YihY/virulence factor BrkB family protein [candidate division Zixibacteria bacterium]|nr:YihY/virulence factor BrkB family protein [candidate division Zixibacteria bacterium]